MDKNAIIVAMVAEDFIYRGAIAIIQSSLEDLKKRFEVGKIIIDRNFHFNGCEIEQDASGSIKMMTYGYMKELGELIYPKREGKSLTRTLLKGKSHYLGIWQELCYGRAKASYHPLLTQVEQ